MKTPTPKSAKTVATPSLPKEFFYRMRNRLLRLEMASLQDKCTQLERTIENLRAQLEDDHDKTIRPLTDQEYSLDEQLSALRRDIQQYVEENQALKNQLISQAKESSKQFYKIQNLEAQIGLLRRNNEDLRKSFTDLNHKLIHQKRSNEDPQKRAVTATSKGDILQIKLHESFKENGLLKNELEETEQVRKSQMQRHKANASQLERKRM